MTKRTCSADGCDRKLVARGYCHRHYCEARKNGMPVVLGTIPLEDRFWSKVDKTGDCWEWTAGKMRDGYGIFNFNGKPALAHRVAWELSNPDAPPVDREVDHICRNRACVNPDHLRLATDAENQQNLATFGRNSRSGVRGVYWHAANEKWVAQAQGFGKKYYLGQYDTLEEAAEVARLKRLEIQTFNHEDRIA